ncbi:MAG: Crp/Fnr family transcriptional regulator [Elusimicrobia bacterium]|nr:Crp/Fnr family transcriptional regulator [Elusimicrobiota bacterium]
MLFSKKDVPDCDKCVYKKRCLYGKLDQNSQDTWKSLLTAKHFARGEFLFSEGERPPGLFLVCGGSIKVCKTGPDGQQLISRLENGGDMLGHIALLAGGNFQACGEAAEDSLISLIESEMFLNFLGQHSNASMALMESLARDVRASDVKARDIAYKPAKNRLADILLRLAGSSSVIKNAKRKDIAEMAGLTVETTVRALAAFEKEKVIKREGKQITLLNKAKLARTTDFL